MNRINKVIEDLSQIVYGRRDAMNSNEMMSIAMATIRDDEGLHEIFYSEVGSHDTTMHVIGTIHDGFIYKGVCDWSPVINNFEEYTGIDFYTLISFVLLTQVTDRKVTSSASELNSVVIVASILARYMNINSNTLVEPIEKKPLVLDVVRKYQ